MIVVICSQCNLVTDIKEEEKPGLAFSHGYCKPDYLKAMEELDEDLSQRRPEL